MIWLLFQSYRFFSISLAKMNQIEQQQWEKKGSWAIFLLLKQSYYKYQSQFPLSPVLPSPHLLPILPSSTPQREWGLPWGNQQSVKSLEAGSRFSAPQASRLSKVTLPSVGNWLQRISSYTEYRMNILIHSLGIG